MTDTANSIRPIRPDEVEPPSRMIYEATIQKINEKLKANPLPLAAGGRVEFFFDYNSHDEANIWIVWGQELVAAFREAGWVVEVEHKDSTVYPGWGQHLYFEKPTP